MRVVLLLLVERNAPSGIYHACNSGETTWHDFGLAALELSGIRVDVTPVSTTEFPRPAARPAYSVLDCSKTEPITGPMPHWRAALARALEGGL